MNDNLNYQNSEPIVLGSGELYLVKSSEISDPSALTTEEEAKLINVGAINSGASVTISKDLIDVYGKNRGLIKKIAKATNVTFKTGIISFILKNVAEFLYGVDYVEDAVAGTKKIIIGDENTPACYLRFIHTDKESGKQLIVNIYKTQFVGENEFNFDDEEATAVNYEFAGLPVNDGAGGKNSYVEFIEYDPSLEA